MYRFINAIHFTLPIRHPAQTRARQEAQAAGDHARLVADDVPEQITRHHHPVQRARVLDHEHRRAVDQLMAHLQRWELLPHHPRHHVPPQARRRQHVRLVQAPHFRGRRLAHGQEAGQPRDALDLRAGVGFRVVRRAVAVGPVGGFLARAEVDAARQLAHDGEVDAPAHGLLERGDGDERGGGEGARAQVAERGEGFAEGEEALLRPDGAGAPFLLWGES